MWLMRKKKDIFSKVEIKKKKNENNNNKSEKEKKKEGRQPTPL